MTAALATTRDTYVDQKRNLALDRLDRELAAARRWWRNSQKPAGPETALWFELEIAVALQELERLDRFAAGESVAR